MLDYREQTSQEILMSVVMSAMAVLMFVAGGTPVPVPTNPDPIVVVQDGLERCC